MVYDEKLKVYAAFRTYAMAVKSCIVLSNPDSNAKLNGLTWFTYSQLLYI